MRFKRAGGKRSGLEVEVCNDLTKRGIKFEYEPDKLTYRRSVRGAVCEGCKGRAVTRSAHYTPDIKLGDADYIEIKGRFTASNRSRMADFKRSNPACRVRLLFAADNWCTKTKRQRYTDWATANGFECAIGRKVPESWIN